MGCGESDEVVIVVRDPGSGFDPASAPDPLDPSNAFKPSGRGIFLMRALMDRVVFADGGREVQTRKRRRWNASLGREEQTADMTRHAIVIVATVAATAAGAWARQVKSGDEEVRTIDVVAARFAFEPAAISVVQGDRVRLRLRSADRTHGIGIKAFRVRALIPRSGEVVTVEFDADRAGTFEMTCSQHCGARHSAMKGRLVVLASGK